ncbi:MAG: acyloxyacyl hydrolase [Pseudomonadota bacterium]|nr:acyloxyacyl hydrolase [Pseudomonadota bacterium]MEE3056460.1 acyloxyacyl hydrolase [Pseudomonadota bacterium]
MKTPVKTLALALSLLSPLVSLSTQALPQGSELKAGAAVWNLFDDADRYALHVAYIHKPLDSFYGLRPTVLLVNADQGQHYFAAGLAKDVYKYNDFSVRVAFHVGIVDESENLGDTIEFYSSLSALYNFSESFSLEAEIGHISNGGLGDTNPGSESFVLSAHYHF